MVAGFLKQLLKEERKNKKRDRKRERYGCTVPGPAVPHKHRRSLYSFSIQLLKICQRVITLMPRAKTKIHKERNALMNKSRNTFRKKKQNCVLKHSTQGWGASVGNTHHQMPQTHSLSLLICLEVQQVTHTM